MSSLIRSTMKWRCLDFMFYHRSRPPEQARGSSQTWGWIRLDCNRRWTGSGAVSVSRPKGLHRQTIPMTFCFLAFIAVAIKCVWIPRSNVQGRVYFEFSQERFAVRAVIIAGDKGGLWVITKLPTTLILDKVEEAGVSESCSYCLEFSSTTQNHLSSSISLSLLLSRCFFPPALLGILFILQDVSSVTND